ncbi:hypothetical protein D3C81_1521530 [compost metagenome]
MQPAAQCCTDECVSTVEQQADADQHHTQGRELFKHRPGLWINKLRQQHGAKQQSLGVEQIGQQTATNRCAPACFFAHELIGQARQHRGSQTLNAEPQQIRGTCQTHPIEGPRRRFEQCRQPQSRQCHVTTPGDGQADSRGQCCALALAGSGLQQQDHVRSRQQIDHCQRHEKQSKSCHVVPHSLSIR